MTKQKYCYDFAISCAGTQRDIARFLRSALEKKGFAVFFYKDFEHKVFGEDGKSFFYKVYAEDSRYCIVLISKEYDQRYWTKLEREIIEARELKSGRGILLPVLTDGHRPRWLLSTRIYFNLKKRSLVELVELLEKKAGTPLKKLEKKTLESSNPPPRITPKRRKKKHTNCNDFNWDELLQLIEQKKVIPVIGHGLYTIEIKEGKRLPLYDFLAHQVVQKCGATIHPNDRHRFVNACTEFLEKDQENQDNYQQLEKILSETLKVVYLSPGNSLVQLARIKQFNLFMTTAYDDLLAGAIQQVRNQKVESIYYTVTENQFDLLRNDQLFDDIRSSRCSMVYHMMGLLGESFPTPYTNKEIRLTTHQFLKDLKDNNPNNLFWELEDISLLFLGFRSDDIFLRSFIPDFANWLYRFDHNSTTRLFIGGIWGIDDKTHIHELHHFLKEDQVAVMDSCESEDFLDCLVNKLEKKNPQLITSLNDLSGVETAKLGEIITPACLIEKKFEIKEAFSFMSFHGANRSAALRLVSNLKKDGINVWYDKSDLEPGEEFDNAIMSAIDKCPVFIPLISQESANLVENRNIKYHCREWERASANYTRGKNPIKIIPVRIDNSEWTYEQFEKIHSIEVPGGYKKGDYKKLKETLLKFWEEYQNKRIRNGE